MGEIYFALVIKASLIYTKPTIDTCMWIREYVDTLYAVCVCV